MHYPKISAPNFSLGGARVVLPVSAGREEWLEARKLGFGASDASSILGLSQYGDRYSVWSDKVGISKEIPDNENMYWGRAHEPAIIQRFREDSGYKVRRSGLLQSREFPFMLYTPDGITEDGGLIEAKTLGKFTSEEWADGGTPDHAYAQVQQGLCVTGRSHAWVCGLIDGRTWEVRRIERDEALIAIIIEEERVLWDMVVNGEEPVVGPYSSNALRDRYPVATNPLDLDLNTEKDREILAAIRLQISARETAAAVMKAAEVDKKMADNNLALIVGNADEVRIVDGEAVEKVLTYKNVSRFSNTRFEAERPDLTKLFAPHDRVFQWEELDEELPWIRTKATNLEPVLNEEHAEAMIRGIAAQRIEKDRGECPDLAEDPEGAGAWLQAVDDEVEKYVHKVRSGPVDEAALKAAHPALYLEYRGRQFKISAPKKSK